MTGELRAESVRRICAVADALGTASSELVFIGGTTLPLLVDVDHLFHTPRPTDDVDAVAAATSYRDSERLNAALRAAGFREDSSSRHAGRWIGPDGTPFDLSFAGRFVGASGARVDELAIATAQPMLVRPELRHVSAVGLFLMKCAAHRDRGRDRPEDSRDLADLAVLAVGAPLVEALAGQTEEVRRLAAASAEGLLNDGGLHRILVSHFRDCYPVPPQTEEELADLVLDAMGRIKQMAV